MKKETKDQIKQFVATISEGKNYEALDEIKDYFEVEIYKLMEKQPRPEVYYLVTNKMTEEDILAFEEELGEHVSNIVDTHFSNYDDPGEEYYLKINGEIYSFEVTPGDCIEARWDGSIYENDYGELKKLTEKELKKFNFSEADKITIEEQW